MSKKIKGAPLYTYISKAENGFSISTTYEYTSVSSDGKQERTEEKNMIAKTKQELVEIINSRF